MITFEAARAFLLQHRDDYECAYSGFKWPDPAPFNWATDWFDKRLASDPASRDRLALWIVDPSARTEIKITFAEMSHRSNQAANWLRAVGVKPRDRILLALGNVLALWEIMLGAMKLGAVVIPATTLLPRAELAERNRRAGTRFVITSTDQASKFVSEPDITRIAIDADQDVPGWHRYDPASASPAFTVDSQTQPDDPLLLYFTSGTTSKPKLVMHTHRSYPVGHLSTMYILGLKPGDIHLNISSPGWAKHAWSCFFAPWNAGATVFLCNQPKFDPRVMLDEMQRCSVTTFCAPPTVWRMLVQLDLASWKLPLREAVSGGEPLNPEIIDHVKRVWGTQIRELYGQTETTCQVGNSPGQETKPGSMGRPMPGYKLAILDLDGTPAKEGEISIPTDTNRPAGLMSGYEVDGVLEPMGPYYGTKDVVTADADGYLTFIGRTDDVFKSLVRTRSAENNFRQDSASPSACG
jgi:acetyl-CoA synthetase